MHQSGNNSHLILILVTCQFHLTSQLSSTTQQQATCENEGKHVPPPIDLKPDICCSCCVRMHKAYKNTEKELSAFFHIYRYPQLAGAGFFVTERKSTVYAILPTQRAIVAFSLVSLESSRDLSEENLI